MYRWRLYRRCCCRLMEAAAWAAARWADTYLMPDEPASEGLQSAFGAKGGGGAQVVAVLLQIANTLLSQCVRTGTPYKFTPCSSHAKP